MHSFVKMLKDNGLSILFCLLFVSAVAGQAVTGVVAYNDSRLSHGLSRVTLEQFLHTGTFLDGMFVNWQAAVLQLTALIVFGTFLYQKGATHSRKLEGEQGKKKDSGGGRSWIYCNSLSIAFVTMFLISFLLHLRFGTVAYNEQRELSRQAPVAVAEFARSANFWTSTLKCWQAEFLAIFVYLLLSVFLRQKGSPESKPSNAPDADTGDASE